MSVSRRRFLRGAAGALLAFPLLESLMPSRLLADQHIAPKRALWWFTPNGHNMEDWTPAKAGADYNLSPILTPFTPYRDKMTVVSGLRNYGAAPLDEACEGHEGASAWLHCRSMATGGGISVDQMLAAELGSQTLFASLEVGMTAPAGGHPNPISWAGPNQPLPKVVSAPSLFSRLFGSSLSLSPEEAERRKSLRLSVLDGVLEDLNDLHVRLPISDQLKLDQYTTALRELELRIEQASLTSCDAGEPPSEHGFDELCEVMVLAFECDLTRVMTFMLNNEGTNMAHTHLDIPETYHGLSHHDYDPEMLAKLTTIQTWQTQIFADSVLARLEAKTDIDGSSLLDNTSILYGSGLGDSHYHDNYDLPLVLFGGTDTFAHGRHVIAPDAALADLHLAMCQAAGVAFDSLGVAGTSPLDGLT